MLDITTLAAWGEFIGGIAVVVSLIYLASQIRQNSRLLTASAATTTDSYNSTTSTLLAQDPEVARIWWDGLADREALPEPDRRRFDSICGLVLNGFQQQFRLTRKGVIDPDVLADVEQGMRWTTQQSGFRQFWKHWAGITYSGDFQNYMDGLIREGEAAE
jgi:hypothetical protein